MRFVGGLEPCAPHVASSVRLKLVTLDDVVGGCLDATESLCVRSLHAILHIAHAKSGSCVVRRHASIQIQCIACSSRCAIAFRAL